MLGELRYSSTHSLTSTLDGRYTPREIASGTHWIEGWWAPEQVWTRW